MVISASRLFDLDDVSRITVFIRSTSSDLAERNVFHQLIGVHELHIGTLGPFQ